jgi:hypothetical protein
VPKRVRGPLRQRTAVILLGVGGRSFRDCGEAIYQLANEGWLCDLYILALKKIPACIASVAISASYGIVAVLAHLLGKEPLGWPQIAGL